MSSYGSTSVIITRQGTEPADFGFEDKTDPEAELEEFIQDLQRRASDEVDRFCSRSFQLHEGVTERLRGNGTVAISLRHYPVVAINEIRVGAHLLDGSKYQLDDTGPPDENPGIVERVDGRVWPPRQIEVDYDWGWEEPPGVVEGVVEDAVVEALEKAAVDRASSAKSSESMDGYSVSWDNSDIQELVQLDEQRRTRLRPLRRRGRA